LLSCNDPFSMTQYCSLFYYPELEFLESHTSWYYSRRSTLNCRVQISSWPSRCVKKGTNIHISTYLFSYPDNVGRHNQPLLGPSILTGDPHGITQFLASKRVPTGDTHRLVHASPISGWAMTLIPFETTYPYNTILSAFGSPEPNFPKGYPS
jgi:hypothetical protein